MIFTNVFPTSLICWSLVQLSNYLFFYQYPALSDPYKFILITILILMTLIEIIRLFLGYAGNLQEKVHHSHNDVM